MKHIIRLALILVLATPLATPAAPPPGYYDSADATTPATLRASVHYIIDNHTKIPYTSSSTDTWNVLELADQDPYNSGRILDVYQNRTFTKHGAGNDDYNREHTWPNSLGFPDDGSSNMPYTDCHHLFLCDIDYNGARGNLYYDDCVSGCSSYSADYYDGQSGVNLRDGDSWGTWAGRQGDVARAMFYMDVRYEGDAGAEPDLILTDNASLIQTSGGVNASVAYMGLLATLLEWHLDDPVDDKERDRNDWVHAYQGNRNPFIDHPEWVAYIFDDGAVGVDEFAAPRPVIAEVYPNPFNPSTTVACTLDEPGFVRLDVFSSAGRHVSVLLGEHRPAGTFRAVWDGRHDDGARVASGAYFLRLQSGVDYDVRKVILLK
ncbi:endonuclease [bacterium]|nr:endonuclease [bacterium]